MRNRPRPWLPCGALLAVLCAMLAACMDFAAPEGGSLGEGGPAVARAAPTATALPDPATWPRQSFRLEYLDTVAWISLAIPPGWVRTEMGGELNVILRSPCPGLSADEAMHLETCDSSDPTGRFVVSMVPADEAKHASVSEEAAEIDLEGVPAVREEYPTPDPEQPPWHNGPWGSRVHLERDGAAYALDLLVDGLEYEPDQARPYLAALDQILASVHLEPATIDAGWTMTTLPAPAPATPPADLRADLAAPTYTWHLRHPAGWQAEVAADGTWTLTAAAGDPLTEGPMVLRGEPATGEVAAALSAGPEAEIFASHTVLENNGLRLPDEPRDDGLRLRWATWVSGLGPWQVVATLPRVEPGSAAYQRYEAMAIRAVVGSGFGWNQLFPPGYPGPAVTPGP